MTSAEHGRFLVKAARKAIEEWVRSGKNPAPVLSEPWLSEKSGVFTTIHSYPSHELRGCIGFPEPVLPLGEAIVESAVSAANDPRFPPLSEEELDSVIIEVSVLSVPKPIFVKNPEEYPSKIKIGRDGLIIELGMRKGLLLPQVPLEWGWDAKEFLDNLSGKAGLPRGSWKDKNARIYSFKSNIFTEKKPLGYVTGGSLI